MPTVDQAAAALAVVMGIAMALSMLVSQGVNTASGMLGERQSRRIVLPLIGIGLGCALATLLAVLLALPMTTATAALILLVGYDAYHRAAGNADQRKAASRPPPDSERG